MLLYDLTSSYVEAAALNNPMRKRGYWRDHRPDCKQVVLALIVNTEGFPLSYETFDGNRAAVPTLEAVWRMVEHTYGQARRVWVLDRGIVSEENLEALRRRQGQYLVGTPRAKRKQCERELLEEGWRQGRPEVAVKLVPTPHGEETYILCRSTARQEKEPAMRSRFSARLEKARRALSQRVAEGKLKDRPKIERRLGALQARHPQVADLYSMEVVEQEGGPAGGVGGDRGARKLAASSGRGLSVADELTRHRSGTTVDELHPTDGSRSHISGAEERTVDPTDLPPIGAAEEGSHAGSVFGLGDVGDAETSIVAAAVGSFSGAGVGSAEPATSWGHHSADDGRS